MEQFADRMDPAGWKRLKLKNRRDKDEKAVCQFTEDRGFYSGGHIYGYGAGVLCQVVNRNIIHAGVSWLEELARYCMVYMALLATEAGLRDNTQISITAITDKIHGMTGRVVRIISKAVVAIFPESAFFHPLPFLKHSCLPGRYHLVYICPWPYLTLH